MIGGGVVITIIKVGHSKVSVGIDADRSVPIHRAELLQAVAHDGGPDRCDGAPSDGYVV